MSTSIPTCELNMRCAGVKRLLKEACELRVPNELFIAKPMEDNLFEWHFTIRGPPDSVYHNGIYHGRIILPVEYPMKPPSMILLTPNGRFETNKKICLSISGYHPETWLPSWSIRTALLALIGFMPTHSKGALGGLECSETERRRLAAKSLEWRCETCECSMRDILPLMEAAASSVASSSALLDELQKASKGGNAASSSSANNSMDPSAAAATTATTAAAAAPSAAKKPTTSTTTLPASSERGIMAHVARSPIRLFASAFALVSTRRTSSPASGEVGGITNGNPSSSLDAGISVANLPTSSSAEAAGNRKSAAAATSPPANRRSWPMLVWILVLSAVFFALLWRRVSNA